ncbi:MAG: glycosyl transferase family 2 [Cytophagales bacterium]|nr:glycosyl transferase family 2 [Cytophagales bacterium]
MIGFIIQARTQSTRLPNKVLLPFYQEQSLLEILLNRLKEHFPQTPIILATSDQEADNPIEELGTKLGVNIFRGSEKNVLNRFIEAGERYNLEKIIRICSDNPFLNISFLEQLVTKATTSNSDYISFKLKDGTPTIKSHWGIFAEYTTLGTLKKVLEHTNDFLYLEHVTNYIYAHTNIFDVDLLSLPSYIQDEEGIRLTLDTPSDFELYQKIYTALGEEKSQSVEILLDYVKNSKEALEIMSNEIQKFQK